LATLDTLVQDIYALLESGKFDLDSDKLAKMIAFKLSERQDKASLRMSNFGTPCERKLWYTVNFPEEAEPLKGNALLKFLTGHILEEVILSLAEQAGHSVEAQQETVEVEGVVGHIDAIVDGVVIDVKSANARSFTKFRDHELATNDPFGYIDQLELYHHALQADDRVRGEGKRTAAFIAVDKELGHVVVDKYQVQERDWEKEVQEKKVMLASSEPPPRGFFPEPHNKSGNLKLPTPCAYCPYKKKCYPGLRTFIYASGPVYMTKVTKLPDVREVR
jgi:CRISPR/Cas system-associated exonuclease Cas4 (RecB family)